LLRVLIVEDEYVVAFSLRAELQRAGHEVVGIAPNGERALEMARQERPDLVLMDLRLPKMDGVTATQKILGETPTAVLLVSAAPDEELEAAVAASGARGYLRKPFTPTELSAGIAAVGTGEPTMPCAFSGALATGSGCGEEGAHGPGGESGESGEG
jgi:DNA-binding response OmpR family regulator